MLVFLGIKKFGEDHGSTDRRMTAARCATLTLVAMANGVEECWMALFPIIPLTYFVVYMPYLASK